MRTISFSISRPYIQNTRPRAKKFFARPFSFVVRSLSASAVSVSWLMSTVWTLYLSRLPSSSGFDWYPAFLRFASTNAPELMMSVPASIRSLMFVLSPAGFIATSTSGASPGVWISFDEKWSWNPDTPNRLPAGARISAGKSGNVEMSLPASAAALANSLPVSCMPSPESPTNRITTRSSCFVSMLDPSLPGPTESVEP